MEANSVTSIQVNGKVRWGLPIQDDGYVSRSTTSWGLLLWLCMFIELFDAMYQWGAILPHPNFLSYFYNTFAQWAKVHPVSQPKRFIAWPNMVKVKGEDNATLCAQTSLIVSIVWCVIERQFVLRRIGKGIRRHDLRFKDIYGSKQMSFFSQWDNRELTDSSLNLCEQKKGSLNRNWGSV